MQLKILIILALVKNKKNLLMILVILLNCFLISLNQRSHQKFVKDLIDELKLKDYYQNQKLQIHSIDGEILEEFVSSIVENEVIDSKNASIRLSRRNIFIN